jgi:hypothetical protein
MRVLSAILVGAAGFLSASAAEAQYYAPAQPAPLYPYAVPANQPYAVEVAPQTYIIRRPAQRPYPYVGTTAERGVARSDARKPAKIKPAVTHNDPAIIEELQRRHGTKRDVIHTKKIVQDPPVVIETQRIVDDPPRVIERRHYV